MNKFKSITEVMNEIDSVKIEVKRWNIAVCLGKSAKYNHDVFLVYIESAMVEGASCFIMQNEFNLHFGQKVKPFLGLTGIVDNTTERAFKDAISQIYDEDRIIRNCNIDELVGSVVPDDIAKKYYSNLCLYVKNNPELFAERKEKSQINEDETIEVYVPRHHLGAFLCDSMYLDKYKCVTGKPALALKVEQFKILCDIDLNRYQVKDVVQAFISRGYILTGEQSNTVEKDLTLSRGNQERCYVLDIYK